MNAKNLISALLLALLVASPAMAKKHHAAPKKKAAPTAAATSWAGEFQPAKTPFKAPEGYGVQVLDPVGARVLKPKGWFYDRAYDPRGYTWIISREDPSAKKGYQTGLRIQLLQGVERGTKKSPRDFVADYFAKKKAAAKALPSSLGDCDDKNFPSLRRACLETEDTVPGQGKHKFHIAYSGFWNDATDTVILMTLGAPVVEWKKIHDTAKLLMNQADLPDVEKRLREAADHKVGGCPAGMEHQPEEKLYAYTQAGGKGTPGLFTIGGIGNAEFAIGPNDPHPLSAGEVAGMIKASPDYKPDAKIILHWPYSTAGSAPFAKELHSILGNEVTGANGPLWWYPDGSTVVTDPKNGLQLPNAQNITTCFQSDGVALTGETCRKIAASLDHSKAIFGNTIFMPQNCDALGAMAFNAIMGQRDDSFALYLYYSFVNLSRDRASTWLSLAAYGHQPLAEYYAAEEVRYSNKDLYRQLLNHAAKDGDKKAATELSAGTLK